MSQTLAERSLTCDGCGVIYLNNYLAEGDPCPLNQFWRTTGPTTCGGHMVPISAPQERPLTPAGEIFARVAHSELAVRAERLPRTPRQLPELVEFFQEEEIYWGHKGDYENWSPERSAIELIRDLRKEIAALNQQIDERISKECTCSGFLVHDPDCPELVGAQAQEAP